MKIKKLFKYFITLSITILLLVTGISSVFASSNDYYLIPSGESIGLKLDTGVRVVGKYQVETSSGKVSPWRNSKLEKGDLIVKMDDCTVENNQDLLNYLSETKNEEIKLTVIRGSSKYQTTIEVVRTKSNEKSLGIYIKDKVIGVGTMTFIDPQTGYFASLGHGIYDNDLMIGTVNGNLTQSTVEGIKKAVPGTTGEKRASLTNVTLGKISINATTGIYGVMTSKNYLKKTAIPVAKQSDVKIGKAKIMTVLENQLIEEFEIEIIAVTLQASTNIKGLKIKVTDDKLIARTGGIVQGMSGSPIIQNGKIVGAVSHVTVENPEIGYGMHIQWMMDEMTNIV